jgi:Bax protein
MTEAAPSAFERYTLILLAGLTVVLFTWGIARTLGSGDETGAHSELRDQPIAGVIIVAEASAAPLRIQVDYMRTDTPAGDRAVLNVYPSSIPHNLRKLNSGSERKRLFIKSMMPLVQRANEQVLEERRRLLHVELKQTAGLSVSENDARWLEDLAGQYGLEHPDIEALKVRVDVVPVSLALAQSAEESGWGTSRFAVEGNALFGQRVYGGDGGMVPLRRDPGKRYRVRTFDHLQESVSRYLHNLNTHWAYNKFRALRSTMRSRNQPLDSVALVGTLDKYSERGADYIKTIRSIISFNGLTAFDRVGGERLVATPGA